MIARHFFKLKTVAKNVVNTVLHQDCHKKYSKASKLFLILSLMIQVPNLSHLKIDVNVDLLSYKDKPSLGTLAEQLDSESHSITVINSARIAVNYSTVLSREMYTLHFVYKMVLTSGFMI